MPDLSNSTQSSSGLAMVRIHLHRVAIELRPKLGCPTGHFPQNGGSASRTSLQLPAFHLANKWLDVGVLGKSHLHETFPDYPARDPRLWGKARHDFMTVNLC